MDKESGAIASSPSSAVYIAEGDRLSYDGNKPLNEIEEDIARTRVRLSATIEALERELTPQRVIKRGEAVLRDALEPPPGPFRNQVWAYAIPLALVVTGLGWLFALRRHAWQARAAAHAETPDDAVETGEAPMPFQTKFMDPVEPVSLVDDAR